MSLHPEASNDFPSVSTMGPLTFNYLPANVAECFKNMGPSKVIFLNSKTAECFTPEDKKIKPQTTASKKRFFPISYNGMMLTFFPEVSSFPMDINAQQNQNSVLKVMSLAFYEEKPTLFLFGKKASFYSKADQKWQHQEFASPSNSITLPWMGAEIQLMAHETTKFPFNLPSPTIPIQKNGSLIKGDLKAVQLKILDKTFWATNYNPLSLNIQGRNVLIEVTKETLDLPFELALTQFKMDKDPGTTMPASYESFVKLFQGSGSTNHHIFMNNPLKVQGYTLYQASYQENDNGSYSSTLTVNVDQGRPLKYLGSLMLVLGAVWHFNLNKKKEKKSEGSTT